jgi:hypothetical protein
MRRGQRSFDSVRSSSGALALLPYIAAEKLVVKDKNETLF